MEPILESFFHGTAAELARDALIGPGYRSNYGSGRSAAWAYVTSRLDIAVLAAEIAARDGRARVYLVVPIGPIEDDPNVTDKKFPGNPTRSFRSREPFRVLAEVVDWEPTAPERLAHMRAMIERMRQQGIEAIE